MNIDDYYFWMKEEGKIKAEISPAALDGYFAGAVGGAAQLPSGLDILIDWDVVNEHAISWLETYQTSVIKGVSNTQRRVVVDLIQAWIKSGSPLSALEDWLSQPSVVGPEKARQIATTEITRIYAEGNRAAWYQSGIVDQQKWQTANDELVCPICREFHGKIVSMDGQWTYKGGAIDHPPAHPHCRCWLLPVVNLDLVEQEFIRILNQPYSARRPNHDEIEEFWVRYQLRQAFGKDNLITGEVVSY